MSAVLEKVLQGEGVLNATELVTARPLAKFYKHVIRPEGLIGGVQADPYSTELLKPRGATFYVEATEREGFVWVSTAICRDVDNFSRSTGRAIAEGRMDLGDAFGIENVDRSLKIEVIIYNELRRGLIARNPKSDEQPMVYMNADYEYTLRRHRELLYILEAYSPAVQASRRINIVH